MLLKICIRRNIHILHHNKGVGSYVRHCSSSDRTSDEICLDFCKFQGHRADDILAWEAAIA